MLDLFSIETPKIIQKSIDSLTVLIYDYQIEHYLFALLLLFISYLVTTLFGLVVIPYLRAKKLGQNVRELGPQSHYSKSGTPTMGGVIFLLSFTILSLIFIPFNSIWLWLILISGIGFGLLGFVDDYSKLILKSSRGIKARYKIAGQILISLLLFFILFIYSSYHNIELSINSTNELIYPFEYFYIPFIDTPIFSSTVVVFLFFILVPLATSNAVNLTDGLDGLASGVMIPVLLLLASVVIFKQFPVDNNYAYGLYDGFSLFLIISLLVGALIAFLWFNSYPAQVFMGDTGSLALGGILGIIILVLKLEILSFLFGFIFVAEALSVMLQVLYFKYSGGKRIFRMAPLHHHFELLGFREIKVVLLFYISSFIVSMLSFLIIFKNYL